MIMFRHTVGVLLIASILAGCSNGQEGDIRALLLMQQNAWNAGDLETFMQGYMNSDSIRFVGSHGEIRGWQTTLERYQRGYPTRNEMGTLSFDLHEIRILGREHAMIFGSYTVQRRADRLSGLFTLIAQDTSNGWRIIHDHTSATDQNP